MKMKRVLMGLLAGTLVLGLCACAGKKNAVYVQSVATLSAWGGLGADDVFAGVVVSESVSEVQKDPDKTIGALLVKQGENVTQGQALFSYDTEQLQLTLDKQRLELEQLQASIKNYESQIEDLQKDMDNAASSDKLQYKVEIQSLQVDLKEAQLNERAKQEAVASSEALLENTTVVAPVTGRIQAINENGMDSYGNAVAYITIQKAGSYRVKGTINEMQRGALQEGTRVRIISRTDENTIWYGTVTLVDYETPTQSSSNGNDYSNAVDTMSEMTTTSKYPFYVALDSTEGLLLGQHVYLKADSNEDASAGIAISSAFICYDEDGTAYVWAENRGRLEKRAVTLGDYHDMTDTVEVLDGLAASDYLAFPDEELCVVGAITTHDQSAEQKEGGLGDGNPDID